MNKQLKTSLLLIFSIFIIVFSNHFDILEVYGAKGLNKNKYNITTLENSNINFTDNESTYKSYSIVGKDLTYDEFISELINKKFIKTDDNENYYTNIYKLESDLSVSTQDYFNSFSYIFNGKSYISSLTVEIFPLFFITSKNNTNITTINYLDNFKKYFRSSSNLNNIREFFEINNTFDEFTQHDIDNDYHKFLESTNLFSNLNYKKAIDAYAYASYIELHSNNFSISDIKNSISQVSSNVYLKAVGKVEKIYNDDTFGKVIQININDNIELFIMTPSLKDSLKVNDNIVTYGSIADVPSNNKIIMYAYGWFK